MQSHSPLVQFILSQADDHLILSHRNSEWCGHAPVLEQDIAISNIALDLLGQARNYYQYAATLININTTEDELAYLRDTDDFLNFSMVELPNHNWAFTILRQYYFSVYQKYLQQALTNCGDAQLEAIAVKNLKEIAYHIRWCKEWVLRLALGTVESYNKLMQSVDDLCSFTTAMFLPIDVNETIINNNFKLDYEKIKQSWKLDVNETFIEANCNSKFILPATTNQKRVLHTMHLNEILNEMQQLHREHPNVKW